MATKTAQRPTDAPDNERAIPGSNQAPDYAKRITEEMAANYAKLAENTTEMLAAAKMLLPATVETPDNSEKLSKAVKEMRDAIDRAEAFRVKEKEPYLRGGNAVDQFFKGLQDRLGKGASILTARVHAYNEKRRLAEEQRRREELKRAEDEARENARKLALARQAEEDALASAARARKPENIEAHQQRAEEHGAVAESARVDTLMSAAAADEARIATLQKPAEMVRERFDSGVLNTMKQVPHVEILDATKLNKDLLWPHIKEEHLLQALKKYGAATSYKRPMDGAIIEMRADTVIR